MYKPKPFDENNKTKQLKLINDYPFATLISSSQGEIFVSHIPLYYINKNGKDFLVGHLAKANDHCQNIEGKVVAIFHGPHTYISHTWYEEANAVPTWNYIAVHVAGKATIVDSKELLSIMNHMLHIHESGLPELAKKAEPQYLDSLISQIVGIQIEIEKIEGKWKLSQNKSIATQQKVINHLSKSSDANAIKISEIMTENCRKQ